MGDRHGNVSFDGMGRASAEFVDSKSPVPARLREVVELGDGPNSNRSSPIPERVWGVMNNAAYGTWAQTAVVALAALFALLTIIDTDSNNRKSNTFAFVQRYIADHPSLAEGTVNLSIMQFNVVKSQKLKISDYDELSAKAQGYPQVFALARPILQQKIDGDEDLKKEYSAISLFFLTLINCVDQDVCDSDAAVHLFGQNMIRFYNSVCPYMEYSESEFHHEEESPAFLRFLVKRAHYTDSKLYFCKDKLASFL